MTQHRRKQLLYALNATLAVGVVLAFVATFAPLDQAPPVVAKGPSTRPASDPQDRLLPLAAYSVIYQKDLRRPLVEPVARGPVVPRNEGLRVVLVGTAVAMRPGGPSSAVFQLSTGQTRTVDVGEEIDGAKLVAVTETTATLDVGGERVTLEKPREVAP